MYFNLILQLSYGQTTTRTSLPVCASPPAVPVPDVFSLDDWQKNPNSFGQTVLGLLSERPYERYTVQRLLSMLNSTMSASGGRKFEFLPEVSQLYGGSGISDDVITSGIFKTYFQ